MTGSAKQSGISLGFPRLSSPGLTGRSSTPRPIRSSTDVSGILDRPLSRTMTAESDEHLPRHISSLSRRVLRPSRCIRPPSKSDEGAGKAGCPPHPRPPCIIKSTGKEPQVRTEPSGLPCAMVLTLIARSPRGPGFFAPVAARSSRATWPQRREARTTRLRVRVRLRSSNATHASIASRAPRS